MKNVERDRKTIEGTKSKDIKMESNATKSPKSNLFQLSLVALVAILLNISGAIVGKYIAMKLSILYIALPLALLLCIIYVGRVVFWIFIGRIYQLSYVYPVLSINYLFSFMLGILLFEEEFQGKRLVGALVIVMGVLVVSLSKHKYERRKV